MKEIQQFDYKDYVKGLLKAERDGLKIVGAYWIFKGYNFDNKEQCELEIKRSIRSAEKLTCYPLKKIGDTMRWLHKNADFKWTIETIIKYINEDLQALEEKAKPKDKRSLELEQAEREKQALKRQQVEFNNRYKIN